MKNHKKHLASFCILVVFALLAVSSSVNHIHGTAFKYNNQVEAPTDNCLVKNDGTKVFGKDISWNTGVLVKKTIGIDGKYFPRSEIRGYFMNGSYYGLFKNAYGRRIIHGKINVYVQWATVSSTTTYSNGSTSSHSYDDAYHYVQMGDDGPMMPLTSKRRIKNMLEACPLAVDIVARSGGKKDPYFNHAFDVYNNGCKE